MLLPIYHRDHEQLTTRRRSSLTQNLRGHHVPNYIFLCLGALCLWSLNRAWNSSSLLALDRSTSLSTSGSDTCAVPPTGPKPEDAYSLPEENEFSRLSHLIIVPGHGIWDGYRGMRSTVDGWLFGPEISERADSAAVFQKHITVGAKLALDDPHSLLVFSGGQTLDSSVLSEAQSYHRLAVQLDAFDEQGTLADRRVSFRRVTEESYALDSYQNLIYSLARFKEVVGHYPSMITVVGMKIKEKRYRDIHRKAIGWPESKFQYIGFDLTRNREGAQAGEEKNGYLPYTSDLYGCHGSLAAKRMRRNPFRRHHPYHASNAEMRELLDWCPTPSDRLYSGSLPWR